MTLHTSLTRRRLLHHGAIGTGAAAALSLLPRPLTAMLGGLHPEPIPVIQDDRIKALVQRGLDAAKVAGATYADIRMTHTKIRRYGSVDYLNSAVPALEEEKLHVGVRALVNGYWGYATSPVWSPEELVRLGREAARQAKANTSGKPRDVVLASIPPVRDGHWETPIEIDPFEYHPNEIVDYLTGVSKELPFIIIDIDRSVALPNVSGMTGYGVTLQSKAFGSTDGSYCTQRVFRSDGSAFVNDQTGRYSGRVELTPTGAGWELFRNHPMTDRIRANVLYNREIGRLPFKSIEVDRYATVLDAETVAILLSQSIGTATQLDRTLGYEANAGGTSYLTTPDEMLGNYKVGNEFLTVTANRNERGGIATVEWDDEGTPPSPFTLIDHGVVSDVQTSREGAQWIKSAYDRLGRPVRSNGCMYSGTANDLPAIHTPNLVMQPATTSVSYENLEAGMGKGMSIKLKSAFSPQVMDFQATNGYNASFDCFEIQNGKRVARIMGGGIMFRTQELWKAITTIGGAASQQRFGLTTSKGQPRVDSYHSVTSVPIALKELTFIDSAKR